MKLLFKQRVFSWLDSYDIFDEEGNTLYTVKGVLAWGHCLKINNAFGEEVGCVKERVMSFLPKFEMIIQDEVVGIIQKELTFLHPKFRLSCNDWEVEGDLWEWEYDVKSENELIMHASKAIWNWSDTYVLDVGKPEHALYSLMIVLAIDAAKCSQN